MIHDKKRPDKQIVQNKSVAAKFMLFLLQVFRDTIALIDIAEIQQKTDAIALTFF